MAQPAAGMAKEEGSKAFSAGWYGVSASYPHLTELAT
jgi:hypothetical protein